ncbi:MAG: hypothetical protein DRG20_06685 [Deltaproteobacteria bacterium]|nr:epoxyqueuosine reductase QueH [Deltaproteobacteria bacterium]RLA88047.1 MAG: hypothetical protein DRG20_06685 [Deltaproteobacteria bacterium]
MRILLHICCANCAIYPVKALREAGWDVMGFFYNPNIHPYKEFEKRMNTLKEYAPTVNLRVIYDETYPLKEFLQKIAFRESKRCFFCYQMRLLRSAKMAKKSKFDAFTTTLLFSKHQNQKLIKELGEAAAKEVGIPFHFQDFSVGWEEGGRISRELDLYRQQYCGCIYSEMERFYKPRKKGGRS